MYLSLLVISQVNFRFQPDICYGCHNLMQKVLTLLIFLLKNYRIHFLYLSKDETINLLNLDLTEKSEILPKKIKAF